MIVSLATYVADTLSVNDNVGSNVSILFTVTVLSIFVSPSVILIVHVSLPVWFASGVYVKLSHDMLHVHLFAAICTVAVITSQLPPVAADNVFRLNVFAHDPISVPYVKLFAVTAILLNVNVAPTQLLTPPSSSVVLYE